MSICLRRREVIAGIGGAAAWPLAARAQQGERVRRIGVLMNRFGFSVFTPALAGLGWTNGRNVRMDFRLWDDDINRMRATAQELVGLQPDIIVTAGTPATVAVQRQTQTIPVVFANVGDPVASGIVARLNRPGGNTTGFANFEAPLGSKLIELLSEIAPGLKRVANMFNPDNSTSVGFGASYRTAARSLKIELLNMPVHSDVEIETAIIALGREPGGGLVVSADPFMVTHGAPVISAAARNNVPAIYAILGFARNGGLLSYGPDPVNDIRGAASYVDRILRGEKPGDLPVQFPTKFEMVVNRKTATALGLAIPPSIMLRADEVIE
jgi:putative ABC transport system substrate-binding protein